MEEEKTYTIHDVLAAECDLQPMKCIHCGYVGMTNYFQYIGDAHCEICGKWQLDED